MSYDGSDFYDDDGVFETYARHRQRIESPNNTLERPIIIELLADVRGLDGLDLGCGDAAFGRELLDAGAASYFGVDASRRMIEQADRNLHGRAGRATRAALDDWDYPVARYDRVCARLVLHYLPSLDAVFRKVHATLRPEGRFVFSVEHPVITSSDAGWKGDAPRQDWVVDGYFDTGRRVTRWLGADVVKYHRTIEDHFVALQASGFRVDSVRESRPERANFADNASFVRRRRIPLFLFMAATKA